jgi:hypothetical protein
MEEGARSGTFEHTAPKPRPEHARLEVFIGKWINEGETMATPDAPASKIVTSDVYDVGWRSLRSSGPSLEPE